MLKHSPDNGRNNDLQLLFSRIARHYNVTNRLMTWGQDARWRHEVLDKASLPIGGRLLDVGAGTGDLSLDGLNWDKSAIVVGVEFTAEMMQLGRNRKGGDLSFGSTAMHWIYRLPTERLMPLYLVTCCAMFLT